MSKITIKIFDKDGIINTIIFGKMNNVLNFTKNNEIFDMTIDSLDQVELKKYKGIINLNNVLSFNCYNVNLERIPIMIRVKNLYIPNCQVNSMANYYNNLEKLNCSFNNLHFIPKIPKCEILDCQNNKILKLPENLENLKELNCSNNNISYLPLLPKCEKLNLEGNPIIYYTDEVKKKFNLQTSPMLKMVYDYINIKNNLTNIIDISERKEDRIEYLFESNFKSERYFVEHIKKLLYNFEKFDIDEKFENFLKQVIDIYNFKKKYIKYKLKYHKLKTKIG